MNVPLVPMTVMSMCELHVLTFLDHTLAPVEMDTMEMETLALVSKSHFVFFCCGLNSDFSSLFGAT